MAIETYNKEGHGATSKDFELPIIDRMLRFMAQNQGSGH
jgi:hypothetical protein